MKKIYSLGKIALGTRLRALSEKVTENAKSVYAAYDVPLKPKWFPVFYLLTQKEKISISEMAKAINHSHPSVVKIVKEMREDGLIQSEKDILDARKTNVALTSKGQEIVKKIEVQYIDVSSAIEELLDSGTYDLWKALDEFEYLLEEKSIFKRVMEKKKKREAKAVQIVEFKPEYRKAFKELNQEWIEKYFKMEKADFLALDNPESYILEKGGNILFATYDGQIAGVCALIKLDSLDYDFELAKMAVSPAFQGKGIGYILGQAIIKKAKEYKAKNLYLESNTILKPAIQLYQKLGFEKIKGKPSPYERSNIQMVLNLKKE